MSPSFKKNGNTYLNLLVIMTMNLFILNNCINLDILYLIFCHLGLNVSLNYYLKS